MALWQWSTIAANNATADPSINWQEGQAPSTVNDSARAMMAAIAAWFVTPEWLNYGFTPTYISATQFTVPGNATPTYAVGRRVRATVTAGTVYGTVSASAFTSLTTVTVGWDSGSLDSGLSEVDVGILNPTNSSISEVSGNFVALGGGYQAGSAANTGNAYLSAINNNTSGLWFVNTTGIAGFLDQTRSIYRFQSDTAGNFTAAGNVAAYSDENLKKEWSPLEADFIDRLAALKRGTFTRIDSGERQVGVGAQSLRAFLPEAVQEVGGQLAVAYGQAAMVAVAELAAEVVRLRALLEPVK